MQHTGMYLVLHPTNLVQVSAEMMHVKAEMMHAVATHVKVVYNVLGSLFPGKTVTEMSPKGKQAGVSPGTKAKKAQLSVDLGTKNTKKEKVMVGAGKSQPRKGASVSFGWCTSCVVDGLPA